MSKLKELRDKKAAKVGELRAIVDAANGEAFTEDQQKKHDELRKEVVGYQIAIAREEDTQELERSLGTEAFRQQAKEAAETPGIGHNQGPKFESIGEQLRFVAQAGINGVKHTHEANGGRRLVWSAALGANEAVPSEGGYLVQTDFSTRFLELMHEGGEIINRVTNIPISGVSNGITLPAFDETSRVNGQRWGGVQGYWIDEAGALTPSKPRFRAMELKLKKLAALGYSTEELLQDTAVMTTIFNRAFSEELRFLVEDAIIRGTGAGQPLGILNSGAVVTITPPSGQANATITTDNILAMYARMPASKRKNAVWLINQEIETQLFGLTLGSGIAVVALYLVPGTQLNPSNAPKLLNLPVIATEFGSALGTAGDIMLVDLSDYVTIDKGGVRADQSMHVAFLTDQQAFRVIYRVDGQPATRTPLTPYKGSATLSPYVILGGRP